MPVPVFRNPKSKFTESVVVYRLPGSNTHFIIHLSTAPRPPIPSMHIVYRGNFSLRKQLPVQLDTQLGSERQTIHPGKGQLNIDHVKSQISLGIHDTRFEDGRQKSTSLKRERAAIVIDGAFRTNPVPEGECGWDTEIRATIDCAIVYCGR